MFTGDRVGDVDYSRLTVSPRTLVHFYIATNYIKIV